LPIFQILQTEGGLAEGELYQVFNMGVGMTLIVAADQAETIQRFVTSQQQKAWLIGEVVKGSRVARVIA